MKPHNIQHLPKITATSSGRNLVIGDIHGCFYTFQHLLENVIKLTAQDQLFLLGDYINRGKRSAKVLDYIIQLQAQHYQVYPLRGNHEQMFLQAYGCGTDFFEAFLDQYHSSDLMNERLDDYLEFCDGLVYGFILDNYLLTHLPLSHNGQEAALQLNRVFPQVKYTFDHQITQTIIHGHQAISLEQIKYSLTNSTTTINLDSGCVYASNPALGHLCALDLNNYRLYTQQNIDN